MTHVDAAWGSGTAHEPPLVNPRTRSGSRSRSFGPGVREGEQEAARLAAVRRYRVLDAPPDGTFDRVTAIAARVFDVPIAIVSVVDADRIWFASHHGLDFAEVERVPGLCSSAILSDEPWIVTDAASDARALASPLVASEFGLRFYAGVPLRTGDGHNLGALCVVDRQPREPSAAEMATLIDLAALVTDQLELRLTARRSVALEGNLRHRAQQLSRTFQESLLPARLPTIAGMELAPRYHVADRDLVGGDFYDVIPAGTGCVVFSGDVSGKGSIAAARTAAARWTLRTLAANPRSPAATLQRLNTLLFDADDDPERSCTIALARVRRRRTGGLDVVLSLAGHPQPLVVRRDGVVEAVGEIGPAIGWLPDIAYVDATTTLGPSDLLVMFTDGLLEAVAGHGCADDTAVRDLLQPLAGHTAEQVARRLDDIVGTAVLRDDAAFLVVRAT